MSGAFLKGTTKVNPAAVVGYVGATATSWVRPGALIDIDYARKRQYVNGVAYASIAAMVTAGVYIGDGRSGDIILPGVTFAGPISVAFDGVSPTPLASVAESIFYADDGNDGVPTDEALAIQHVTSSGNRYHFLSMTAGGVTQSGSAPPYVRNTQGTGAGAAFRTAARFAQNDLYMYTNGNFGDGADTSASMAAGISRIFVGSNNLGQNPFTGTLNRITVYDGALTNAALLALAPA